MWRAGAVHMPCMHAHAQDMGGCYLSPDVMETAIVISHFGFIGGTADWMSRPRWQQAIAGQIQPADHLTTDDPEGRLSRSATAGLSGGRLAARLRSQSKLVDSLASTWGWNPKRWFGRCYNEVRALAAWESFGCMLSMGRHACEGV